jgi:large subunit ribosomal protein L22
MKVTATAKFVGTSTRKLGLVAATIRGQHVTTARATLEHVNKRATTPIGKVLDSAIANAENNYRLKSQDLSIETIFIGPGPTLKRFRPRAKGAAGSIKKRSSHITVILTDTKPTAAVKAASAANTEAVETDTKETN